MAYQTDDLDYCRKFAQAITPMQATRDQIDRYYVEMSSDKIRGIDLGPRLIRTVELTLGEAVTLVTGPTGSGKSSELLRFGDAMEQRGHPCFYSDIMDVFRPDDPVDPGSFLIGVVVGLVTAVESKTRTRVIIKHNPWKQLEDFFHNIHITGIDLNAGPLAISSSLRDSEDLRQGFHAAIKDNRTTFRTQLHDLVRNLSGLLSGPHGEIPVFIVDSIDHFRGTTTDNYFAVRKAMQQIFFEYAEELKLPGLQVIYSVPEHLQALQFNVNPIRNIKVFKEDGTRFQAGINQLYDIAYKRSPTDGRLERLFGPDRTALDEVLYLSGGLFRDLFRLLYVVIRDATTLPVTQEVLIQAIADYRSNFVGGSNGLSREQVKLLAQISGDHQFVPSQAQQSDFEILKTLGAILHYPDGPHGFWIAVHPLLKQVVDHELAISGSTQPSGPGSQ